MAGLLDPSGRYFCSMRQAPHLPGQFRFGLRVSGGLAAAARKPLLRSGPRFAPLWGAYSESYAIPGSGVFRGLRDARLMGLGRLHMTRLMDVAGLAARDMLAHMLGRVGDDLGGFHCRNGMRGGRRRAGRCARLGGERRAGDQSGGDQRHGEFPQHGIFLLVPTHCRTAMATPRRCWEQFYRVPAERALKSGNGLRSPT
jgi:hypothetical protein